LWKEDKFYLEESSTRNCGLAAGNIAGMFAITSPEGYHGKSLVEESASF